MSDYFQNFNKVDYAFGDEFNVKGGANLTLEVFQDLSAYVDMLDEIKDIGSYYFQYNILENDRPDQVSMKIYGTTNYHWTFYLMNDHVRRQGWPLSMRELDKKIKRDFPHKYVRTLDSLTGIMLPGQRAYGSVSSGGGKILRRHLDLGTIIIDSKDHFQAKEKMTHTAYEGITSSVTIESTGFEYNAPRYYEDGNGDFVDIDPSLRQGALLTEVTNYDHYIRENDKLKQIRVLRPDAIQGIVGNYLQALTS